MSLKKSLLALSVAALSTLSFSAMAASTELSLWEDIQKSKGLTQAVADFEKQYDCKVNIQEMPFIQTLEKLRLDGPSGIGPDVLLIPGDQLGAAVVQGMISPMANATGDNINDYVESALGAFTSNGQIYGYPKVVETLVLFYNKDKVAKPFKTFNKWFQFSQEQKDKGEYGLIAKFDQVYYTFGAIYAYGGYIFKRDAKGDFDPKDVGLATPGSIEAVNYIKTFFTNGLIPNGILGDNGLNAIDSLFTEQKAAAVINGPWAMEPYAKAGVNYGVTPLPQLPNGQSMSSLLGVKGYVISSWSSKKDLAEKFIQFINQPQYAKIRFEQTSEIPPLKSVMNDPIITKNEAANAVAIQSTRAVPMPAIPEMAQVWTPIDAALQLSVSGKQDVKGALEGAAQQINDSIEAFRSGY